MEIKTDIEKGNMKLALILANGYDMYGGLSSPYFQAILEQGSLLPCSKPKRTAGNTRNWIFEIHKSL
jgi:hypothetical protein